MVSNSNSLVGSIFNCPFEAVETIKLIVWANATYSILVSTGVGCTVSMHCRFQLFTPEIGAHFILS